MSDVEGGGSSDGRMVSRMLFFADAVFAIVLTLMVLDLRTPAAETDAELLDAIIGLKPKFVAFFASFALVSVFWASHMAITRKMSAFDWPTAWLNLVFLFTIAVMPFVSGLIGERGMFGVAWQAYCVALIAASLAQTALLLALTRGNGRFVTIVSGRERIWRTLRALSPGIAFAGGLALSLEGQDLLSQFCWMLIPVILIVARLCVGPRKEVGAADA